MPDAQGRGRALEVVGRRRLEQLDQAEDDVGGRGEAASLARRPDYTLQSAWFEKNDRRYPDDRCAARHQPRQPARDRRSVRLRHRGLRLARERGPRRSPPAHRELPPWLARLAAAHGAGEVGGRRADDAPLVRRPRDAPPLRDRRREGLLRQPLPRDERLPRRRAPTGEIALLRVRHRPVPLAVQARLRRCSRRSSPTTPTSTW